LSGSGKKLTLLSLGCGCGKRELKCAELDVFSKIDAYDISEDRINFATKNAENKGYSHIINYKTLDVKDVIFQKIQYDVILFEQSLHHFSPLREILKGVNNLMKNESYLIINEFTGPSRFQWTDRQLEVINGLLSILPYKYRIKWKTSSLKTEVYRNGRLAMALYDPSEAIESSKIIPLLEEIFSPVEVKEIGGTILMLLFNEIAHNFKSKDKIAKEIINFCFDVEDILIKNGDIKNNFTVGIYKKKDS
jgi:ubiquinone/menaquinone biosynthesis C-methylase UbiE